MATPKKKTSKARKRQRRSHHGLDVPNIGTCQKTGLPKLAHRICEDSGYYSSKKQVFEVGERL